MIRLLNYLSKDSKLISLENYCPLNLKKALVLVKIKCWLHSRNALFQIPDFMAKENDIFTKESAYYLYIDKIKVA